VSLKDFNIFYRRK